VNRILYFAFLYSELSTLEPVNIIIIIIIYIYIYIMVYYIFIR